MASPALLLEELVRGRAGGSIHVLIIASVPREVENWRKGGGGFDRSQGKSSNCISALPPTLSSLQQLLFYYLLHTSCQATVHYPSHRLQRNILCIQIFATLK